MADRGGGLVLLVEVPQDPTELLVRAQVRQRRMTTGDENAGKRGQLVVTDGTEGTRVAEAVLTLHSLDEVLLPVTFVKVPSERQEGFTIGVRGGLLALGRREGDLVAGGEELLEWFGELHEEVAGGLVDDLVGIGATGLLQWEGIGITKDDEDFLLRHVENYVLCVFVLCRMVALV